MNDTDPDPCSEKNRKGSGSRLNFDTDPDPGQNVTDPDPGKNDTDSTDLDPPHWF